MGDITGKNKKLKTEKGIMMGYAGSRDCPRFCVNLKY